MKYVVFVVLVVIIGLVIFISMQQSTISNQPENAPLKQSVSLEPTASSQEPPKMTINQTKQYNVTMTTSMGIMKFSLFPKETPVTVNNFVVLSEKGFYNGTQIHRIIKGFMIQGGDPLGNGTGGPGYKFADELIVREYRRGILAMANSGPNTNGSQFFIIHADYNLPKNYVIFGQIDPDDQTSLTTLDSIASVSVVDNGFGEQSKPTEVVTIQSVVIEEQ